MPVVLVQNEQSGPTVLASDPKGSISVEFAGKGDPDGGDVQPVPEEIVDTVPFYRALQRGVLSLVNEKDNPDITAKLAQQKTSWQSRNASNQAAAEASISHERNDDLVVAPCLGPKCQTEVPVKDVDKDRKPPLCDKHIGLASEFVPESSIEGNRAVTRWTRVSMGARERAQQ